MVFLQPAPMPDPLSIRPAHCRASGIAHPLSPLQTCIIALFYSYQGFIARWMMQPIQLRSPISLRPDNFNLAYNMRALKCEEGYLKASAAHFLQDRASTRRRLVFCGRWKGRAVAAAPTPRDQRVQKRPLKPAEAHTSPFFALTLERKTTNACGGEGRGGGSHDAVRNIRMGVFKKTVTAQRRRRHA